jgi:hypothetical protein
MTSIDGPVAALAAARGLVAYLACMLSLLRQYGYRYRYKRDACSTFHNNNTSHRRHMHYYSHHRTSNIISSPNIIHKNK